jgi:hypothetical protein
MNVFEIRRQLIRAAARLQGIRHQIETQSLPDVLGIYVYLPVVQS